MADQNIDAGWSSVPNWVIRSDRLKGSEKWVYIALLNRASGKGVCNPSLAKICSDTDLSKNTVIAVLKSLEGKGLLTKVLRRKSATENDSNLYYVHAWKGGAETEPGGGAEIALPSSKEGMGVVQNRASKKTHIKNTHYGENVESDALEDGSSKPQPFPEEFFITDAMKAWAKNKTPALDLVAETKEFVAYWRHGEGKGKKKKNWVMAWQNRMRKKYEWLPVPEKNLATVKKVKRF